MPEHLPSQDRLLELFDYDKDFGILSWKENADSYIHPRLRGKRAGCSTKYYRTVCVDKRICAEHQVIWKMINGEEVKSLDHKNGDGHDNRISNLRKATIQQQNQNTAPYGIYPKGVSYIKDRSKFKSQIKDPNGKRIFLGYFDSADDAASAYRRKAEEFFGEFAYHRRTTSGTTG